MTYRGTTNRNDRGSSTTRRRRREWLVSTYRADVDAVTSPDGMIVLGEWRGVGEVVTPGLIVTPACRCYRCGELLTVDTVTADRIKPGCEGGTYARANIRPACGGCNSATGGALGAARKRVAS